MSARTTGFGNTPLIAVAVNVLRFLTIGAAFKVLGDLMRTGDDGLAELDDTTTL